jgi:hypothetical protein
MDGKILHYSNEHKITEFELQALVYSKLKRAFSPLGLWVRGEMKYGDGDITKRRARFDIVLIEKKTNKTILIIEVKDTCGHGIHQKQRYEALTGVPCLYIDSYEKASHCIYLVLSFLFKTKTKEELIEVIFNKMGRSLQTIFTMEKYLELDLKNNIVP